MHKYFEHTLETNISFIAKLPTFLKKLVVKVFLNLGKGVLDLNYFITKPYTNKRW